MKLELTFLLAVAVGACEAPPVAGPVTRVTQNTPIRVSQNTQAQADILFMVDNSPSMESMQAELVAKFQTFLDVFDSLAHPTDGSKPQFADLHIGVVTSDYGAGNVPGSGCDPSPGGQMGLLQAKGAAADASCSTPMGASFIEYAYGASGDTCNLPSGCSTTNLGAQFTCMASVGAMGCGFEHQLESVHAAITSPTNAAFFRQDALLAIVFVTNEDDGSAPPTTDIFNPAKSQYGAYTTYRQTRFGVACGQPPALTPEGASGVLTDCEPAPTNLGQEFQASRYTQFFGTPGVVKADPINDIILVGIDAPEMAVQTLLATTNTGLGVGNNPTYEPCSVLGTNCVVALQHSCQNGPDPEFFGDPAVRLNDVINASNLHQTASICGADLTQPPNYSQALLKVASLISSSLKPGCVPAELPDVNNPDCDVVDITTLENGMTTQVSIPSCAASAGSFPCWKPVVTSDCAPPLSPQSVSITIDRNGMNAPPMTNARVECSTKACPANDPDC